jgi:2,3-bisphosphoglycerate-dependent phosphoglycerate mutase
LATLVLLRHGESEWNAKDLFAGWVDVPLAPQGREEAWASGRRLAEAGLRPDVVHTSLLTRAVETANAALAAAGLAWLPVRRSWRLNERHYGALQGRSRAEIRAQFGDEQFMRWRRSYAVPPPPITDAELAVQASDPRYSCVPAALMPRGESLRDVERRLLPHWHDVIVPDLAAHRTTLIVAHGNALRALIKHLDSIGDDAIAALNIPTGMPLVYDIDSTFRPVAPGGRYLDPETAAAAAEKVRDQGRLPRRGRNRLGQIDAVRQHRYVSGGVPGIMAGEDRGARLSGQLP